MSSTIKNKKQYAYENIRERILNGTYLPGFRIVIDHLAKEFGLSSIPVREALNLLESDGLVEYKPFSGPQVRLINESEYINKHEVLALLEGYASALSSKHISSEDIVTLEQINEMMKQSIESFDLERFSELNKQFHSVIYEKCSNTYLVDEIKNIWERSSVIKGTRTGLAFRLAPQRCLDSIKEHEEIIRLLRVKAASSEIEMYVREHKLRVLRIYQEKIKNK